MKRISSGQPILKSSWCVGLLSTAVAMRQLVVMVVAAGVLVIVVVLVVLALSVYRSHECSVMQTCCLQYHRGRSAGC
jgi:hypothetical protein